MVDTSICGRFVWENDELVVYKMGNCFWTRIWVNQNQQSFVSCTQHVGHVCTSGKLGSVIIQIAMFSDEDVAPQLGM